MYIIPNLSNIDRLLLSIFLNHFTPSNAISYFCFWLFVFSTQRQFHLSKSKFSLKQNASKFLLLHPSSFKGEICGGFSPMVFRVCFERIWPLKPSEITLFLFIFYLPNNSSSKSSRQYGGTLVETGGSRVGERKKTKKKNIFILDTNLRRWAILRYSFFSLIFFSAPWFYLKFKFELLEYWNDFRSDMRFPLLPLVGQSSTRITTM